MLSHHATPDVDLKPEVSSLASDSEQNWDEDKPVKTLSKEESNLQGKGPGKMEQSTGNFTPSGFISR